MRLNVDDAVRYMGAGKGNAEIREMTAGIAEELEKAVKPQFTWRAFHIEKQEGGVLFRERFAEVFGKGADTESSVPEERKGQLRHYMHDMMNRKW